MTREKAAGQATAVRRLRLRVPSSAVPLMGDSGHGRAIGAPSRSSKSNATITTRRLGRRLALMTVVAILGCAGIAGASTWTVVLTSGTHSALSQSTSVNAPTGGTVTNPNASSLSLSWVMPSVGAAPTGYKVTRDGAAVPGGSGCRAAITRISTTTSCIDSGLAASTLYTYSVTALVGTHWTSVASSTFSGTTTAPFVITSITSTNAPGNTTGLMGVGDTFAVTFNYAVDPSTINTVAGASTMTLVATSSKIKISGLTLVGGFVVNSPYISSGNSTATGTLSLSNADTTVTFTVTGSPTNPSKLVVGSPSTFTFTPLATIQDVSGDTASPYSQSPALQIF